MIQGRDDLTVSIIRVTGKWSNHLTWMRILFLAALIGFLVFISILALIKSIRHFAPTMTCLHFSSHTNNRRYATTHRAVRWSDSLPSPT